MRARRAVSIGSISSRVFRTLRMPIRPAARQDSFTMAIGHVEGDIGILDVLLEKRPPFVSGIDDVVSEFCAALREYGLFECVGDRYAAGFTVEAFRKHGVEYRHSDMTTSDYFCGFLPILNSRRAQLLDHKRLAAQLCSLERRPSRIGAKDQSRIHLAGMMTALRRLRA